LLPLLVCGVALAASMAPEAVAPTAVSTNRGSIRFHRGVVLNLCTTCLVHFAAMVVGATMAFGADALGTAALALPKAESLARIDRRGTAPFAVQKNSRQVHLVGAETGPL
jgi:hypothetical protein